MLSKTLAGAAILLGLSSLSAAQTTTLCDPLKTDCPNDPAFGGDASYDFSTAKDLKALDDFWHVDDGITYNPKILELDGSGAKFTMHADGDSPLLISKNYLFFGRLDVTLQAAPGAGIVTSIVLQSDDRDEIDWEIIGSKGSVPETNFYSKGEDDHTHGGKTTTTFDTTTDTHTYSIDWTPEYIAFSIDGQVVRKATPSEVKGADAWPQTPAQVRLGAWVAGGADAPQGRVDWAGGHVDWSKGPFAAVYKKVTVKDYGGGTTGAKEYSFKDHSGSWQSIEVHGGSKAEFPGGPEGPSNSGSPSSSATTTTTTTSTSASGTSESTSETETSVSTPIGTGSLTTTTTSKPTGTSPGQESPAPTGGNAGGSNRSTTTGSPSTTTTQSTAGAAGVALNSGLLALLVAPLFL